MMMMLFAGIVVVIVFVDDFATSVNLYHTLLLSCIQVVSIVSSLFVVVV